MSTSRGVGWRINGVTVSDVLLAEVVSEVENESSAEETRDRHQPKSAEG